MAQTKVTSEQMEAKLLELGSTQEELDALDAKEIKKLYTEKMAELSSGEDEIPGDCVKVKIIQGTIFGRKKGEELIMLKEVADSYGPDYVEILE